MATNSKKKRACRPQFIIRCHVPTFGNAVLLMAVSDSRCAAFNHMRRKFHYDNWKKLDEEGDMGGWTLELDKGHFFVWVRSPQTMPPASFSFENIVAHEMTHVLRGLIMYVHTTVDEANEPSAYLMGWLVEACCALRDGDIAWLTNEGFIIEPIPVHR